MATLQELEAQQKALDAQIAQARKEEFSGALNEIQAKIEAYGFDVSDVFPKKGRNGKSPGKKVSPKYRDPATGATWTGRGKPPAWIRDQDRGRFVI